MDSHQVEELICIVASLDRGAVIRAFQAYQANFPLDFTPEFLATLSDDRLKHIFVAMCLQCQRLPHTTPAGVGLATAWPYARG